MNDLRLEEKKSVLFIFIDGLGIGERSVNNPFARIADTEPLAHFVGEKSAIPFGGIMVPTDPRLKVEGRPQSASGQTTILTGINAPLLLGHHKQGFPNQTLRDLISENSIFLQLKKANITENVFANAYTPQFFAETPRWKSATTCAVEAAELSFRKLPDLLGGKALFHDFTNADLIKRGFEAPLYSAARAAEILAGIAANHRFTLYEHFITDQIGHKQDFAKAEIHLPQLAEFIRKTIELVDLENTTVILTSDHGNIEDLSVRNHTLNDVPTIIWGAEKHFAAERIKDLTDITPTILQILTR